MPTNSTSAKDGGANQSKTIMPPVSAEYRSNYESIFGKSKLEILAEKEYEQQMDAEIKLLNKIFKKSDDKSDIYDGVESKY